MKISDEPRIGEINTTYHECEDGLFIFIGQAEYAIDTAHLYCEDGEYWVVCLYQYSGNESHPLPEVCNFSYCAEFGDFTKSLGRERFIDCYKRLEQFAFTSQAEMLEYIMEKSSTLNHY